MSEILLAKDHAVFRRLEFPTSILDIPQLIEMTVAALQFSADQTLQDRSLLGNFSLGNGGGGAGGVSDLTAVLGCSSMCHRITQIIQCL